VTAQNQPHDDAGGERAEDQVEAEVRGEHDEREDQQRRQPNR
jgi:hypothetical protein